MAAVLTAVTTSVTPIRLRITATNFRSFITPAIYVPYPSGYGNQRQIILSGISQTTASVTVGGKAFTATQTGSSYEGNPRGSGGGFPVWATATVAAVGAALFLVFVVMVVLIFRRKLKNHAAAQKARYARASAVVERDGRGMSQNGYGGGWSGASGPTRNARRSSRNEKAARGEERMSTFPNRPPGPYQVHGTKRHSAPRGPMDPRKERTSFVGSQGVPVLPIHRSKPSEPKGRRNHSTGMTERPQPSSGHPQRQSRSVNAYRTTYPAAPSRAL